MTNYEKEKQIAITTVTAAAQLCQQVRHQQNWATLKKADASPVTIADFGSQAIICQGLSVAFPDDPIIAEEDATFLEQPELADSLKTVTQQVQKLIPGTTPPDVIDWINRGNGQIAWGTERVPHSRYWTLDPIDGTKGFIRGDQYAIALALVEKGEVKLGILACPALAADFRQPNRDQGVIFLAIRGQSTEMISIGTQKSQFIRVNDSDQIEKIRRIESVESAHSDRSLQIILDQTLGLSGAAQQMDSQAKYGAVARGEADLYLRIPLARAMYQENIWDHAAGSIIVEQAGGKVSDLEGKPLDFSLGAKLSKNRGIVVSNGNIHPQVLKALTQMTLPSTSDNSVSI
ncbi:3'(2'),5'-bisphosphate nucleotidase [Gloeothece verrucosa]|uniref:3'(2'),5'-bisphosphate nucleotidase n=1 Tax=Gloeothece verrucosa (strain PCC 7822) TaxID=497965 RepID=E0U796_GLOV7|nr:3'(2'),5'-bisphosphate nucleotidase [Gloeothece verrucosa]ADN12483.1 3'(2'),5'-bisphosphate nucleotidase [Gloeothece verrucosa PCC 7822]